MKNSNGLTPQELLWGLAHKNEEVSFPTFCYWMKMCLTEKVFPFDEAHLGGWRKNKELMKVLSVDYVERNVRQALLFVLENKSEILFGRIWMLLHQIRDKDKFGLELTLAALDNIAKFQWWDYSAMLIVKGELQEEAVRRAQASEEYESIVAALKLNPALFVILEDNTAKIAKFRTIEIVVKMLEVIRDLWESANDTNWKGTSKGEELETRAYKYFCWIKKLRMDDLSNFIEITKLLDQSVYKTKMQEDFLEFLGRDDVNSDLKFWEKLVEYVLESNYFGVSWQHQALKGIFDRKIDWQIDCKVLRAFGCINEVFVKIVNAYTIRYPEEWDTALMVELSALLHDYAKFSCKVPGDVDTWSFRAKNFSLLPKPVQEMELYFLEKAAKVKNHHWDNYLEIVQLRAYNPELNDRLQPLIKCSLAAKRDEAHLKMCGKDIRELLDLKNSVITNMVADYLSARLSERMFDKKIVEKVTAMLSCYDLNIKKGLEAQRIFVENAREQEKKQKEIAKKEKAEIAAFLAKLK